MKPATFKNRTAPSTSHQGSSLIIVLILLVIVSILGIGAVQISIMGERSARNDRDYQIAWQGSEAGLMDAEFDIRGPNTSAGSRLAMFADDNPMNFVADCGSNGSGLCQPALTGKPVWLATDFTDASSSAHSAELGTFTGRSFDAGNSGIKPVQKPRYIIEILNDTPSAGDASIGAAKKYVYRVTSMGFGPRADIQAVTQMLFRKE